MVEKRGRGRPPSDKVAETVCLIPDDPALDAVLSETLRLRQRWELASVLNFLHVFKPLIESDLQVSAEEIETALISPSRTLTEIHIALLKDWIRHVYWESLQPYMKLNDPPVGERVPTLGLNFVRKDLEDLTGIKLISEQVPILGFGMTMPRGEQATPYFYANGAPLQDEGIPPVNKNLMDANGWVTVVCKKLSTWWPWVADGENPLTADHGEEILRYEELDPVTRLLILKALCEVRGEQEDILRYISDALKKGTPITTFRKERIGGDDDGTAYWYDGDPVIGYRLYREVTGVGSKQKLKGKGRSREPTNDTRWETVATNFEEFQEISDNLSSSKIMAEIAVGEIIKNDILPVLEEHQKKKARTLKRQQRQALLLDSLLNSTCFGSRHSRRERKPVKYTFDEYDRNIDEAIEISKKSKAIRSDKEDDKQSGRQDTVLNGSMGSEKENSPRGEAHGGLPGDDKCQKDRAGDDDDEDDDYDDEDDDHDDSNADDNESEYFCDSDREKGPSRLTRAGAAWNRNARTEVVAGLRRSRRAAGSTGGSNFDGHPAEAKGHAEMKKRLRQRPTRNTDYGTHIVVSDSEDGSLSGADKQTETVSSPERESSSSATATDEPQDCGDDEAAADGDD